MSAVSSVSAAPTIQPQSAAPPSPRELEAAKLKENEAAVQNPKVAAPKSGQEALASSGMIGTLVNQRV